MRKIFFTSLLLSLLSGNVFSQFAIGHTTITFTDSARSNRSIATEIYYPADVAGDNVPVANGTQTFPVLSFGHGFVMTYDAYANIWETAVPAGYIIAFPKTEGGIAPSHGAFGADLAFVLRAIHDLSQTSTSLFYNRADTMNCVMGHSMGGGASFIAAQNNTNIKALLNFAAAETNPSAIAAANAITQPALIFAGGNDCVAPPAANQLPMYDSLQSLCKTYISITGGSHCQMADNNFLCSFGEGTCSPAPAITRAAQHAIINRYILPWLDSQLKNSCAAGVTFDSLITADAEITFEKTCILCHSTYVNNIENTYGISIYPNPVLGMLHVSIGANDNVLMNVYDAKGIKVFEKKLIALTEDIHTRGWHKGLYFIQFKTREGSYVMRIAVY